MPIGRVALHPRSARITKGSPMSLPIPAGTYGIDTMHSQLGFGVTHLNISIVRGTFDSYDGSLTVGDSLADTSLSIEADMTSVASGHPGRDQTIQNPDFFDSENHPKMTFASTAITENGDGYTLTGDLTIKGVTQSVDLAVTYNGSNVFPLDGSTHYGFSATGQISRSAFGVSYGVPMVTDEVDLNLEAQFIQPAS